MKEFWKLKQEIKTRFMAGIPSDRSSKEFVKSYLKAILDKSKKKSKLSLILRNAMNNYKTDNKIVDSQAQKIVVKQCKNWPTVIQNQVDKAFDLVAEELRLLKKSQKDKTFNFVPRHIIVFDYRDVMLHFGTVGHKGEKLVKFEHVFLQIPSLEQIKEKFKEFNTSKFGHIGSLHDEALTLDKEKLCEELISTVKDNGGSLEMNGEFSNLLRFGVPAGTRYKFYKSLVGYWEESERKDEIEKIELSESELEMFRFILYEDANVRKWLKLSGLVMMQGTLYSAILSKRLWICSLKKKKKSFTWA
jgi:hypothetical protein